MYRKTLSIGLRWRYRHDDPGDRRALSAGPSGPTVMSVTACDLLIVGAGPVGLYAAYYAGFRGLRTALVDSLPEAGGQVSAMYPEKPIYDIAGFPVIRGRDLVARLVEQAGSFSPAYLLGDPAKDLTHRADGGIEVATDSGVVIRCGAVLI